MKILVLSDLHWASPLKSTSNHTVNKFCKEDLGKKKYQVIQQYWSFVEEHQPNLVLFAGDITGDGGCGHGYQNAMKILLKTLEERKIPSFFISGNHDEVAYYQELVAFSEGLTYSKDISDQVVDFQGIKILGIPYSTSTRKSALQQLIKKTTEKVAIVLAHAELKRRTWLFDLHTDCIITGHFDKKMSWIDNKVFVSLENDFPSISYCCLEMEKENVVAVDYFLVDNNRTTNFRQQAKDWTHNKGTAPKMGKLFGELDRNYLQGQNLKEAIERIRAVKNKKELLSPKELKHLLSLKFAEQHKISKTMLVDYVGSKFLFP